MNEIEIESLLGGWICLVSQIRQVRATLDWLERIVQIEVGLELLQTGLHEFGRHALMERKRLECDNQKKQMRTNILGVI